MVQKRPEFSRWWVKIADFGISKQILEESDSGYYTTVGTLDYFAPEVLQYVAQDQLTYTNKVDIWCLGVVLFYVGSQGHVPFSTFDLMKYCEGRGAFNPKNFPIRMNDDGVSFLKALLQPQPDQRPTVTVALQHSWLTTTEETATSGNVSIASRSLYSTAPLELPTVQLPLDSDRTKPTIRPTPRSSIKTKRAAYDTAQKASTITSNTSRKLPSHDSHVILPPQTEKTRRRSSETSETSETSRGQREKEENSSTATSDETVPHQFESNPVTNKPAHSTRSKRPNESIELRKRFVDNDSELKHYGSNLNSQLRLAVRQGQLKTIQYLVDQGADPRVKGLHGETIMHIAAEHDQLKVIQWLEERGADIHSTGNLGRTLLYSAAFYDRLEMVKWLKEQGADVNARFQGSTPLHTAAGRGRFSMVKVLTKLGADIHAKNHARLTPIHQAAFGGHIEIVKWLRKRGAKVTEEQNFSGDTTLHIVARKGLLEIVQWLVMDEGFDINTKNAHGDTPLYAAMESGNLLLCNWLEKYGGQSRNGAEALDRLRMWFNTL